MSYIQKSDIYKEDNATDSAINILVMYYMKYYSSFLTLVWHCLCLSSLMIFYLKLIFLQRRLPHTLEGSFEFFINLLGNPLLLPTILQHSLLSLLIEYIPSSSMSSTHFRTPPGMYKHLQPFITLFIRSPDSDIRNKAYYLAQASILSTGALDQNVYEVGSWFLYLSNYDRGTSFMELGIESLDDLIYTVISFLCDAISTVGNNLFKYWGILKSYTNQLKDAKGNL